MQLFIIVTFPLGQLLVSLVFLYIWEVCFQPVQHPPVTGDFLQFWRTGLAFLSRGSMCFARLNVQLLLELPWDRVLRFSAVFPGIGRIVLLRFCLMLWHVTEPGPALPLARSTMSLESCPGELTEMCLVPGPPLLLAAGWFLKPSRDHTGDSYRNMALVLAVALMGCVAA